jgi:uncharacterized protein with GYD domain
MPKHMLQFSYSSGAVSGLLKSPQDRTAVARGLVEGVGGKLESFYYCFGEYDGVAIAEFPDNASAAAASMALSGSGGFSAVRSTVLLTAQEAVAAMRKAGGLSYRPPSR